MAEDQEALHDPVKKPSHYTSHPSGVECKDIIVHYCWAIGSAMKYLWRWDKKGDPIENLRKAQECIQFKIDQLEGKKECKDVRRAAIGNLTLKTPRAVPAKGFRLW